VSSRILFVGWDGADWSVLTPMISAGSLPTLGGLMRRGRAGTLLSTFPPHSVAAWSSFLTGKPASEHGVLDFSFTGPGRYLPDRPHSARSLPRPTLLDSLNASGVRVLAANIPMTYPPAPINGAMISGVFLPPGRPFTHPADLEATLRSIGGFPINGLEWNNDRPLEALFEEARTLIGQRTRVFRHLLDREAWDVALVAYMAPDRLQHVALHLLDRDHPRHASTGAQAALRDSLTSVFDALDRSLGELIDDAQPEVIVVASDHGFRPVWRELNPNRLLERLGYLRYHTVRGRANSAARALVPGRVRVRVAATRTGVRLRRRAGVEGSIDWGRTRAYAPSVTSQGIRLNVRGREPRGVVASNRAAALVEELQRELADAAAPDGTGLFEAVTPSGSVLSPAVRPDAPDLFYEPGAGTGLSMQGPSWIAPAARKSGEHRAEGIVVLAGDDASALPGRIWEVPHLILTWAGVHETPTSGGAPAPPPPAPEGESEAITEHLRGLGYVE
jgi:predicted AlkP superfamily phosphohydrolase/phosphomutase